MRIEGKLYSIEDLIEEEKQTCAPNVELTFKLIALSHYLDSEEVWQNQYGHPWSIPKLIEVEMSQPVNGAACGGTHRIMGCTYAVYKRERQGQPVTGQWARAKQYVRNYQRYALSLQNRDGSFSSDWFKRRRQTGAISTASCKPPAISWNGLYSRCRKRNSRTRALFAR